MRTLTCSGKQTTWALLAFLACGIFGPAASAVTVPQGASKPISYQPPKEQARAEIKWVKEICVEKDRYIGWPTVCRLANGDLLAVFSGDRDSHICPWGKVQMIRSTDDGETWCPAYSAGLPNNNSGIDLVRLADGRILLCLNPVSGNWAARSPLALCVSQDDGATFTELLKLELQPGEYSYPALVAEEEKVYLIYTWNRRRMAFWEIELEPLEP